MVDENLVDDDNRVVRLMDNGQFTEAREACQRMLENEWRPINRAVFLSNIMTCYEKEGDNDRAVETGTQTLDIIDSHRLNWTRGPDGDKAAAIRGYVRGRLRRLKNEPLDWRDGVSFFAAYLGAALVGAMIGTNIQFGYNPGNPTPIVLRCPDARYLLAPLCGFIGQYMLYRVLRPLGGIVNCLVVLVAAAGLGFLFYDLGTPQVFIAVIALLLPMAGIWLIAVVKLETGTFGKKIGEK